MNENIKTFFDNIAVNYTHKESPLIDDLLDSLFIEKSQRLLDLGCGKGIISSKLAKKSHGEVIGLDISSEMIKYAKESTSDPKVKFVSDVVKSDVFNEDVCCPNENTHLYDSIKNLKSTKGVFVGHDHVNTFCVDDDGLYLCYGIKATTRVYYEKELMGGQIVSMNSETGKISIERKFHTYDELEGK